MTERQAPPALAALRDALLDALVAGAGAHVVVDRLGRALEAVTGGAVTLARRGDDERLTAAIGPTADAVTLDAQLARLRDAEARAHARDALIVEGPRWRWHAALGALAIELPAARAPLDDERALIAGVAGLLGLAWRGDVARAIARRDVGQLASRVAHDINNIVTVIASSSDLLADAVPADDPGRGDLELINDAVGRARLLSQHLMMVAQRQPWHAEPLELASSLAIHRRALAAALGPEIEVALEVTAALPPVGLDDQQLGDALHAAALHLRRVLGHGGRLELVAAEADGGVTLTMTARPRAASTSSPAARSAGLALLAARAVFSRAGGDLEDRGTVDGAAVLRASLPTVAAVAAARPGVLLVVPAAEADLGKLLDELGFAVETVGSARDAARAYARDPRLALVVTTPALLAEVAAGPRPPRLACFLDDTDPPLAGRAALRAGFALVSRGAPAAALAAELRRLCEG